MEKKVKKVKTTSTECSEVPKKRGRPRKNPLPIVETVKPHRSRGRPRKFKVEDGREPIPTRTSKHFGYCPDCRLNICSLDIKYTQFSCPRCGKEGKVTDLAVDLGLDRSKTKKEYLQSVNSTYVDWYGNSGKEHSKALPKVEDTIETVPLKDDEENLLEDHDKDAHETI